MWKNKNLVNFVNLHIHLHGRKFTLQTDHQPFMTILGPKKERNSPDCSNAYAKFGHQETEVEKLLETIISYLEMIVFNLNKETDQSLHTQPKPAFVPGKEVW